AVAAPAASGKEHPSSPAVRRLAEETGISPSSVKGTGKDGRVTKGDMLSAADKGSTAASAAAPAAAPTQAAVTATPATGERTSRVKMTPLRRKIAERLVAAQHEAALLTTFNEVDMSGIM